MSIYLVLLLVLEQYLLVRTPFLGLHLIHYTFCLQFMKQCTIPADASLADRNIKPVIPPSHVMRTETDGDNSHYAALYHLIYPHGTAPTANPDGPVRPVRGNKMNDRNNNIDITGSQA
jgi:hypothetical protein